MFSPIADRYRNRFARNPYFHFHQLHPTFALIASGVLFVLMALFLYETR